MGENQRASQSTVYILHPRQEDLFFLLQEKAFQSGFALLLYRSQSKCFIIKSDSSLYKTTLEHLGSGVNSLQCIPNEIQAVSGNATAANVCVPLQTITWLIENQWLGHLISTLVMVLDSRDHNETETESNLYREFPLDPSDLYESLFECNSSQPLTARPIQTGATLVFSRDLMAPTVKGYGLEWSSYGQLLAEIVAMGGHRAVRNGATRSKFSPGRVIKFSNISQAFPLLTSKRVFWRGVVEELLFFLKGKTDVNELKAKNVHIWDKNTTREFLDSRGLHDYKEGIAGPIYGFQWRFFGAKYDPEHPEPEYYTNGDSIDQIQDIIRLLKTDPYSRRIFMTAWNVLDLDKMALPPCHVSYQFYVDSHNRLNSLLYMRSSDLFLGLPFNIASTALLTMILAKLSGLSCAHSVSVAIGDAHIYENHVPPVLEQLARVPKAFPKVVLSEELTELDTICPEHFILQDYSPHPRLAADMNA
jgi:thymidylate synthase